MPREVALAGHMIEFHTYPVRILKQHRVVTRCKVLSIFRAMDHPAIELLHNKLVYSVDIFTRPGAKAEVV